VAILQPDISLQDYNVQLRAATGGLFVKMRTSANTVPISISLALKAVIIETPNLIPSAKRRLAHYTTHAVTAVWLVCKTPLPGSGSYMDIYRHLLYLLHSTMRQSLNS
jgi:hypothetical protein